MRDAARAGWVQSSQGSLFSKKKKEKRDWKREEGGGWREQRASHSAGPTRLDCACNIRQPVSILSVFTMFTRSKFEPEPWMGELAASLPSSRVSLARLPTPTHVMRTPADIDVEVSLKRDDMTSFELSGNKVRKLEFLLADALEKGYDSVVTIGAGTATSTGRIFQL